MEAADKSCDRAVDELVRIGPAAVYPLIDVLKNSKCELARMGAADALGRIGTEAGAVYRPLPSTDPTPIAMLHVNVGGVTIDVPN